MPMTTAAVKRLLADRGVPVYRAASDLPATTTTTFFTVVGKIELTGLLFIVTTVIQAQANAVKWRFTPTGGSIGDVSATLDINGYAVGAMGIAQGPTTAGAVSQAITGFTLTGGAGITLGRGTGGLVLADGVLGLNAAATNTGQVRCIAWYRPLEGSGYLKAS